MCLRLLSTILDNMSSILTKGESQLSFPYPLRESLILRIPNRAVNDLGGKTRIMELMSHADPDVQFQSLMTVQRLVSHSWMS